MSGNVKVRWESIQWVSYKEDGTILGTSSSAKTIVQNAIDYATTNGYPLSLRNDKNHPFAIINDTITFQGGFGNYVDARGTYWTFNNTSQHGLVFDTQAYGSHDFEGARTYYTGTGFAVWLKPVSAITQDGLTTYWTRNHCFNLGNLIAGGSHPSIMVNVDAGQVNGANQFLSSAFVDSKVIFNVEGRLLADYGIWVQAPSGANQVVGENTFEFYVESCLVCELAVGSVGASNQPGTNIFTGAPVHTHTSGIPLVCHGIRNQFYLKSLNCFANGPSYCGNFTTTSDRNFLLTRQIITQPSTITPVLNQGTNNTISFV